MVAPPWRSTFIKIDFEPQAGHEQMGFRPALVVSHTAFNRKLGFAFVCPLSTTNRRNRFYVPIPYGLSVNGVVMCDQMRSLDYVARNAQFLCECPDELFAEVLARIKPILF